MPTYLIFTLAAPLAAMGEIAVGERRASWSRPGRSAVFGVVAAALGVTRDDQAKHDALEAGYGLALWTEISGRPFGDYHTAQAATAAAVQDFAKTFGRPPASRREELLADDIETIVSNREYRSDGLWFAALWARDGARWSLETLAESLRRPHFTPYFGRRACPFGLPLAPAVLTAETVEAVFHAYCSADPDRGSVLAHLVTASRRGLSGEPLGELACDRDAATSSAQVGGYLVRRRDVPGHRRHHLFADREELVVTLPAAFATIQVGRRGGG